MFFVILTQKTYFGIAQDYNLRLMLYLITLNHNGRPNG